MRPLALIGVTLALVVALAWAVGAATSAERRLAAAQAAWAGRSFAGYRATIAHRYSLGDFLQRSQRCTMTVEQRGSDPVRLLAGDCAEPLGVATILARFERYAAGPVASRRCGYGGCVCALSSLTIERAPGAAYPRRIARDWRDATVGAGPGWALLARLPAPLRSALLRLAERNTPCPPGTINHTSTISPIHSEEFEILSLEPLP